MKFEKPFLYFVTFVVESSCGECARIDLVGIRSQLGFLKSTTNDAPAEYFQNHRRLIGLELFASLQTPFGRKICALRNSC